MNVEEPKYKYRYLYLSKAQCAAINVCKNGNLCLTIRTKITKIDDGISICEWAVAFKNPTDQMGKKAARAACEANATRPEAIDLGVAGTFKLRTGQFDHGQVIDRVLMSLLVNNLHLTTQYQILTEMALLDSADRW